MRIRARAGGTDAARDVGEQGCSRAIKIHRARNHGPLPVQVRAAARLDTAGKILERRRHRDAIAAGDGLAKGKIGDEPPRRLP